MIATLLLGAIAVICFVLGVLQLSERGVLLNNAYLYATPEERKTMNKKPHYRQSGIVFLLIGLIFALDALEILLDTGWLGYVAIGVIVCLLAFAVVSSVVIEKKK